MVRAGDEFMGAGSKMRPGMKTHRSIRMSDICGSFWGPRFHAPGCRRAPFAAAAAGPEM